MFIFTKIKPRVVEAYVGEYASGKSELSINRALELRKSGRKVNLVDLDTVEPFYTLRPIKKKLEEEGLNVISFSEQESFGLGETGAMLNPRARWALKLEGDIILDIGYGVHGTKVLNLVEGASSSPELKVILVVNSTRPMTNSAEKIKEYIEQIGRVDSIVANTHLGQQTTVDLIKNGFSQILAAAREANKVVEYVAVEDRFRNEFSVTDFSVPIKFIKRYMVDAIW
ncbi:MAG: hypothetical protein ACOXZ5_07120 [Syntrophomonadaceae bacterium]